MAGATKGKRGRPATGFDKKAYDARRMKEIRAGTWKPKQGKNA